MKLPHREPYRIKRGYGLSPIRTNKEMKALLEFCRNELKQTEIMKLNPERKRIYETTIELYENWAVDGEYKPIKFKPVPQSKEYYDPQHFIDDHCGWYWN